MISILAAKTEGPNTFWSETGWLDLRQAQVQYPTCVYREHEGKIQWLVATSEGPNTFWKLYSFRKIQDADPYDTRVVLKDYYEIGEV